MMSPLSMSSPRLKPVPPSQSVTLWARSAEPASGGNINLAYHGSALHALATAASPTGGQPVYVRFKQPIRIDPRVTDSVFQRTPLEATQTLVELSQQVAGLIPGAGESIGGGLEVTALILMPLNMRERWLANERHIDGKLVADACEWVVGVLASVLSLTGQPLGQQFKVVGFVIKVGRGLVSFALDPVQAEARQPTILLGAAIARGP